MALNEADVKAWMNDVASGNTHARLLGDEDAEKRRKRLLTEQATAASGFAGLGETGYSQLGADARSRMDYLRRVAGGGESIAAQQLRQGTQALQGQQRSMAAAAAPRDAAGASHSAALNSARLGYGMSGQAALAGLQERRDAEAALSGLTMGLRGQDLQAALQSRQTAMQGQSSGMQGPPEKGFLEKYGPAIGAAATMAAGGGTGAGAAGGGWSNGQGSLYGMGKP